MITIGRSKIKMQCSPKVAYTVCTHCWLYLHYVCQCHYPPRQISTTSNGCLSLDVHLHMDSRAFYNIQPFSLNYIVSGKHQI